MTYSIIAVDPARGEVGAAGASCVPYEVIRIHGNVAGRGAFVAQANFDDAAFEEALEMLGAGSSAPEVLARVTDPDVFSQAPYMQWGVVDVAGGIASFTGPLAMDVALDETHADGDLPYAALGNVLTSGAVVDQAAAGFESGECDLAGRLVRALEAAGASGEGDARCTPEGRPADSAFVHVTSSAGEVVRISIPDVSPDDPVAALRQSFDQWREEHPCPDPPSEGGGAMEPPPEPIVEEEGCTTGGSGTDAGPMLAVIALFIALRLRARGRPPT